MQPSAHRGTRGPELRTARRAPSARRSSLCKLLLSVCVQARAGGLYAGLGGSGGAYLWTGSWDSSGLASGSETAEELGKQKRPLSWWPEVTRAPRCAPRSLGWGLATWVGSGRLSLQGPAGPPGRRVGGLLCKPHCLFSRPGSLGSRTHPPLDSIQEAAAFLLVPLGFSGFLKTQWPRRKEEGAELWRNVRVSQGLRSQKEQGARAAGVQEL